MSIILFQESPTTGDEAIITSLRLVFVLLARTINNTCLACLTRRDRFRPALSCNSRLAPSHALTEHR
jgi:hypothetical protein